jgi:hypothetical protein
VNPDNLNQTDKTRTDTQGFYGETAYAKTAFMKLVADTQARKPNWSTRRCRRHAVREMAKLDKRARELGELIQKEMQKL